MGEELRRLSNKELSEALEARQVMWAEATAEGDYGGPDRKNGDDHWFEVLRLGLSDESVLRIESYGDYNGAGHMQVEVETEAPDEA